MLTNRFGFKEENITVLLDDSSDPNLWPTGNNMRYHMRELVNGAQSGDSLLFHFSGQPSCSQRCLQLGAHVVLWSLYTCHRLLSCVGWRQAPCTGNER